MMLNACITFGTAETRTACSPSYRRKSPKYSILKISRLSVLSPKWNVLLYDMGVKNFLIEKDYKFITPGL